MITSAYDIPHDGYWRTAGQVFQYPMVTVFAATKAEADAIAGPEHMVQTYDQLSYALAMLDSAQASSRLGIWGRPDLFAVMLCGDQPVRPAVQRCDNCGAELRTGMPDGRAFELVHADGGTRLCPDGSGNRAAFRGAVSQGYA
jgi:hypothetical protein